jgi:hypothetical protein
MLKYFVMAIFTMLFVSCAYTGVKVLWSINNCEAALSNRCDDFCKLNKSRVETFTKTTEYYHCGCAREIECKFRNMCE